LRIILDSTSLVVWDFYHIRKNVCLWLDIWVTQIVEADAWETTGLSPAGVEYRKVYNRLKAKKQRGKISRDEWNATVSQAQKVTESIGYGGELSDEEVRRRFAAF